MDISQMKYEFTHDPSYTIVSANLDSGERITVEAGSMMSYSEHVEMETHSSSDGLLSSVKTPSSAVKRCSGTRSLRPPTGRRSALHTRNRETSRESAWIRNPSTSSRGRTSRTKRVFPPIQPREDSIRYSVEKDSSRPAARANCSSGATAASSSRSRARRAADRRRRSPVAWTNRSSSTHTASAD